MNSAIAIIYWNDKVLFFHRDNIPSIHYPDCWGLPGGVMDPGETPDETVRRELVEEVSYAPANLNLLGKKTDTDTEGKDIYIYLSQVSNDEAKLFKLGPGEGQEINFFTLEEALQLKLVPTLETALRSIKVPLSEIVRSSQLAQSFGLTL